VEGFAAFPRITFFTLALIVPPSTESLRFPQFRPIHCSSLPHVFNFTQLAFALPFESSTLLKAFTVNKLLATPCALALFARCVL